MGWSWLQWSSSKKRKWMSWSRPVRYESLEGKRWVIAITFLFNEHSSWFPRNCRFDTHYFTWEGKIGVDRLSSKRALLRNQKRLFLWTQRLIFSNFLNFFRDLICLKKREQAGPTESSLSSVGIFVFVSGVKRNRMFKTGVEREPLMVIITITRCLEKSSLSPSSSWASDTFYFTQQTHDFITVIKLPTLLHSPHHVYDGDKNPVSPGGEERVHRNLMQPRYLTFSLFPVLSSWILIQVLERMTVFLEWDSRENPDDEVRFASWETSCDHIL